MVDVQGRRIIQWDLKGRDWREWSTEERVGWVIPCEDRDSLLAGLQSGMARIDLASAGSTVSVSEWLAKPFDGRNDLRLNDAKADGSGAVWAGSLNNDDESRSDGCLFRLSPGGQLSVHDTGYLVANGPAIHPSGQWMLHTDSGRRIIYAFDLDAEAGQLRNKRVWRELAPSEGYPDGMTFDAEGCLWLAHWGGACVSRLSPEGELMRQVSLPASHITNVCFGGEGLDRLFASSARQGLCPEQRQAQPMAGALFEIDPLGVTGLPGLAFAAKHG